MDQISDSMNKLLVTQSVLGQLGFTLTSDNKYYKDYLLSSGVTLRIQPVFDTGISMDRQFKLIGFNIITSTHIPVSDTSPVNFNDFPVECSDDINRIVASLAPSSRSPMAESFIITVNCSACNTESDSFIYMQGKYVCTKCMGMD